MAHKAIQYATLSQVSLYAFMGLCIILNPHFAFQVDEGGLSNYGLYAKTVVPYSLGLGLCGLFIWRARQYLPEDVAYRRVIKSLLALVGLFFILELLSTYTYKLNATFTDIHIALGACLLISETVICTVTSLSLRKGLASTFLFMAQLLGFILVTLALTNVLHILMVAELLAGVAFAVILYRMMVYLAEAPPSQKQSYDKLIHGS